MQKYKILVEDCANMPNGLSNGLYHGCICDPPYGLNFMGEGWDNGIPSKLIWRKIFDLLVPGSILIAFGGTRTYHRLACNIEDAGFQIRDNILFVNSPEDKLVNFINSLDDEQKNTLVELFGDVGLGAWMYGTGMPKNMDISKEMDAANNSKRIVVGKYKPPRMPKKWGLKSAKNNRTVNIFSSSRNILNITKPSSEDGIVWDGYGTSLKPVWEPIIIAMKPIEGNYISNAKKYGVAGINIDESRIPLSVEDTPPDNEYLLRKSGRWPANVIVSHSLECGEKCTEFCPVKSFKSTGKDRSDSFGMTRFIYCKKPDKNERNFGVTGDLNNHPTLKPIYLTKYLSKLILPPKTKITRKLLVPFAGSGSEMIGACLAGWDFVEGIEINPEYVKIANQRLNYWNKYEIIDDTKRTPSKTENGLFDINE